MSQDYVAIHVLTFAWNFIYITWRVGVLCPIYSPTTCSGSNGFLCYLILLIFFILLVLSHPVAGLRWIHMLTFAWNFINMTQRALLCSYVPYTHPLHVDLKFTNETPEWLNVYASHAGHSKVETNRMLCPSSSPQAAGCHICNRMSSHKVI